MQLNTTAKWSDEVSLFLLSFPVLIYISKQIINLSYSALETGI